jgi:hypothetical protein
MLKFSSALYGLLRKYKKDTHDLAKASGFRENVIYEWRCGRGSAPSPGHLIKLAHAFGTSPKDVCENHLSLLYDHLLDDCVGPAAKYINVEVLPTALPIVSRSWSLRPTCRRSELDLEAIKKHIWYDAKLQKTIRDIAKPLKRKPIPTSLNATEPKAQL